MVTKTVIPTDITKLKTDVQSVTSDVSTLKQDTTTLKSDVSTLKSDTSTLKSDTSTLKSDVGNLKTREIVNTDWTAQRPQNQQNDSSSNFGTGYKLISRGTDIDGKTYAASLEMVRVRSDGIINARINVVNAAGNSIYYDFNDNGEIVIPPKQNISARRLRVGNDGNSATDGRLNMWGAGTRADVFEYGWSGDYGFYMQRNSDKSKEFHVNGNITSFNVSAGSDRDLKENIQVIDNATDRLRKMYGYTYTLKSDGMPYAGVIAQEAMEAIPEVVGGMTVYTEEDKEMGTRYLTVNYSGIVGLLVQVCREADDRINKLETEIEELKTLVNQLISQ